MASRDPRDSLRYRLHLLKGECALYDHGDEGRAAMIAVHVRDLIYQKSAATQKNQPILRQLDPNFMDSILLASTMGPDHESRASGPGVFQQYGIVTPGAYRPKLLPKLSLLPENARLPLRRWWDEQPVITANSTKYTRKVIVMTFADKVGAHSDQELDDDVARDLLREPHPDLTKILQFIMPGLTETGLQNVYAPALRTIGYEILCSESLFALAKDPEQAT